MAQGLTTHQAPPAGSGVRRAPSGEASVASQASLAGGVSFANPASRAPAPAPSASSAAEVTPPSTGLTADGRVILNLASADELRKLPGVGQKRAEAIVALRQKLGRFKRPADLLRIRGVGQKRLKQMLPKLVLDPPKEAAPAASSAAPAASSAAPAASSAPAPRPSTSSAAPAAPSAS
jgi:competence protein ComEA